jgi:hypothetical protein
MNSEVYSKNDIGGTGEHVAEVITTSGCDPVKLQKALNVLKNTIQGLRICL